MRMTRLSLQVLLAGACIANAASSRAQNMASPPAFAAGADMPGAALAAMPGMPGMPPGPMAGHAGHEMVPPPGEHGPMLPFLRGIELDEAQDDKLFAILHAQAPAMREYEHAMHKAQESLRTLAMSGTFDEKKAAALAQALAQSMQSQAMLRARTDAQIVALLTPEQRQKMAAAAMHPPVHH